MGRIAINLAGAALLMSCGASAGADAERGAGSSAGEANASAQTHAPAARKTAASSAGSGCRSGEIAIYQCRTKDKKTIAVCSTGGDTATYRFGGAKPEIEIEGGRWARVGYSGGGELQIAFTRDPYRYVVFSRTVRTNFEAGEPNNPAFGDGVLVLKGDKFVGMKACADGGNQADYNEKTEAAMQRLPQQNDLFTYETSRADPAT